MSSWGKRMFFFADLLLVLLLDTFPPQISHINVRTQYSKVKGNVRVDMCAHKGACCAHSYEVGYCKRRRPVVLGTTNEASNHNVIEIYAMTNKNHTTLSPVAYCWLFLAVRRSDAAERPHREAITAPDERTARQMLAGQFVLSFAGRLPVQGVKHA
nr:host cell division inhibitor Icd-like protein [Serratia liquefaciens]